MKMVIVIDSSIGVSLAEALAVSAGRVFGGEIAVFPIVSREIDPCPEMDFALMRAMFALPQASWRHRKTHVLRTGKYPHIQHRDTSPKGLRVLPHDRSIAARIRAETRMEHHQVRRHRAARLQGGIARSLPAFPVLKSRKFRGRGL